MPVEGQWERVHVGLRPRDRRVLAVVGVVAALAIAIGLFRYATRPAAPSNQGCVVVTLASTMGGGTLRNCGAAAKTYCRADGGKDPVVAEACRRAGIPLG